MSAGHAHRRPNRAHFSKTSEEHPVELRKLMEQPTFIQMWMRPYRVDVTKQIPDSAGYGVSGDTYFIDRDLYHAVLSRTWTHPETGKVHRFVVPGLTPHQVLDALLTHERIEKCLLDADNDIDTYLPAHEMATCGEHLKVVADGGKAYQYEDVLEPIIEWNQRKPLTDVPLDLSCAPLLDDPDVEDKVALKTMRRLGVFDAFKVSKEFVKYSESTSSDRCGLCAHFNDPDSQNLAKCDIVDGLVRRTHWCTKFQGAGW